MIKLGLAYYILTLLPLKGVGGSFYFLAGAAIRQSGKDFITIFTPFKGNWGILSPIIFILLILPQWSIVNSQWSMVIVYFAIFSLLFLYKITPPKGDRGVLFLGRNSLPLYVFSPIFTILCKRFVPYLQFDPTGLIFLLVSLVFCVSGSLAIAWAMDKTGISRYFFGRKAVN